MAIGEITEDWFGPETATFGDRLAGAREAAGMSHAQLARRLGVRKSTLSAWEDDHSEPRANKLQMMSGLLNVSIMWLLTGEGEGAVPPETESNPDLAEFAAELRELRADMRATVERAARLEKRMRQVLELSRS